MFVCVVGCYAQVAKDVLSEIDDIDIILGTNDRKDIVSEDIELFLKGGRKWKKNDKKEI